MKYSATAGPGGHVQVRALVSALNRSPEAYAEEPGRADYVGRFDMRSTGEAWLAEILST